MTWRFPPGFLWGVTTGAHQTEGNNLASDWWASENAPDTTIDEPSGDAADSYHRWREDMDLAAAAGFTDYRFGIEWSRVEPADGRIYHAAVAHYYRMVTGAIERGLRPLPTLHHFTNPLWFTLGGGWSRRDAVERFLRYVDALTPVLGAGVERVETINEPNIYASLESLRAPGAGSLAQGLPVPDPAVTQAMIAVHRATRNQLVTPPPGFSQVARTVTEQRVAIPTPDAPAAHLDIHMPNGPAGTPRPVILWVHGGGFISSTGETVADYAILLAHAG